MDPATAAYRRFVRARRPGPPASWWNVRLALAAVLAIGLLLAGGAIPTTPATATMVPAADVVGDDQRDVYSGSGGLLLPGSIDDATRRQVASCPGCRWRLTTVCVDPGLGAQFDQQSGCGSVVRGCPQGRRILRAWFRPEGQPWRDLDVVCVDAPVTVRQVDRRVADRVEQGIPPLEPSLQPALGVVSQLPVRFRSGQVAGPRHWTMSILGRPVEVTAVPRWSWSFGDGRDGEAGTWSTSASSTEHVYRGSGVMTVEVRTRWTATFVVDGLGPFPVDEDLTQSVSMVVPVGQGRAVLVPG